MSQKPHPFDFRFPQHWQHVISKGLNRFVTKVVHQLPDGSHAIWSSRRFRKRRSSEWLPSSSHRSQLRRQSAFSRFHVWGWKLHRLSWWIGLILTLGSILFVIGAIWVMIPTPPLPFIAMLNFIGSVCFTVGFHTPVFRTDWWPALSLNPYQR